MTFTDELLANNDAYATTEWCRTRRSRASVG